MEISITSTRSFFIRDVGHFQLFKDSRFLPASLVSPDQFGEFWFFNGLWGLRQPVGAGKAPTGLLTPGSGATKYLPNFLLG